MLRHQTLNHATEALNVSICITYIHHLFFLFCWHKDYKCQFSAADPLVFQVVLLKNDIDVVCNTYITLLILSYFNLGMFQHGEINTHAYAAL